MDAARQIEQSVLQQLKATAGDNSGAHTMEASIMAKVESRLAASHAELDARINSLDGKVGQVAHKSNPKKAPCKIFLLSKWEELKRS